MLNFLKHFIQTALQPPLRPITVGVLAFLSFNLIFTLGVTLSPLNQKFNFSYGNFLPTKLALLRQHQPEKLDVLFLGTSQTNNGFITRVFEQTAQDLTRTSINSFNLGLPNNRYDVMLGTLQMHIHRYGKPRLVLVELSPSIQERNSMLYYLPALYHRSLIENDPSLLGNTFSNPLIADNVKKEMLFSSASSLYQYRHTFSPVNLLSKISGKLKSTLPIPAPSANAAMQENLAAIDFEGVANAQQQPTRTIDPTWTEKGWYPKEQSPHMTTPEGVALSVTEARKYYIDGQPEVNFDKLRHLLAWCHQQNIPVVLVSWPNHPAYLQAFQKSALSQPYTEGVQALLQDYPVPHIDFNQELATGSLQNRNDLFADPRHLTPEGARYFSQRLAQKLSMLVSLSPNPAQTPLNQISSLAPSANTH